MTTKAALPELGLPLAADPYRSALRRLGPGFLAVAGFSAVISLLMLTGSIYMLQVYDRVLASGSVPTLLGLFAIVVVLYLFLGLYDFLRMRLLSRLALRLNADLGAPAFGRWLDSGVPGAAADAATPLRDLDTVRATLGGPAMTALFDLPWVPLYLAVLFVLHPWLGWLTVAGAGIVAVLALVGHLATKDRLAQSVAGEAAVRDFADKGRRNAESIRAMGMAGPVTARWRQLQGAMLASGQGAGDLGEMLAAASRAFRMLMQSAMLTLGAWLVIRGEISGGAIIASSILSGRALSPVDQVIGQWRTLGRGLAAHRRLGPALAAAMVRPVAVALPTPAGRISVTRLTKHGVAKSGAGRPEAPILDGVSFDLEPGEGLGVIGTSASGKSTLARLLVGAWTADGGEVRLDGATLDQWDPGQLGRHIGYLPQQIDLLPGSIRDNIARFDPATDDAAVIAAAQLAGVHEMILRLPEGYGTRVGLADAAPPLSGGQVQRIGLARAVCGAPRLVVLDEPNSNLDMAGDAALTRAILALRAAGAAVIVVAHRPSAMVAMTRIMVLEAGRVMQFGPKDAVLAAVKQARQATAATTAEEVSRPAADQLPSDIPPNAWRTPVLRVVAPTRSAATPSTVPLPSTPAAATPEISAAGAAPATTSPGLDAATAPADPPSRPFGGNRRPGAAPGRMPRIRRAGGAAPITPFRKDMQ